MIYTSYWSNIGKLRKAGIEPVAVSRGKPKNFNGRYIDSLAPSWAMLKMDSDEYDELYQRILDRNDADDIVRWLGNKDVALCCWEKNPNDCHRSKIAKWLRDNGYECEEYVEKKEEAIQLTLF